MTFHTAKLTSLNKATASFETEETKSETKVRGYMNEETTTVTPLIRVHMVRELFEQNGRPNEIMIELNLPS